MLEEIVRTPETDDTALATAWAIADTLRKRPVLVNDAPGFVVNRLLTRMMLVVLESVERGNSVEEADAGVLMLGLPMAPSVLLAFTADDGKSFRVDPGLRVQSVPGQDEQPQIFEALETVTADSRLNRRRVMPARTASTRSRSGRPPRSSPPARQGSRQRWARGRRPHRRLLDRLRRVGRDVHAGRRPHRGGQGRARLARTGARLVERGEPDQAARLAQSRDRDAARADR
jgi:hypothetical protein